MSRRNLQRAARPKAKQLKLKWGALGDGEPELCVSWGEGIPRGAGRMLYSLLDRKSYCPLDKKFGKSPIEVLEEWGFDLETLKIEITLKDKK